MPVVKSTCLASELVEALKNHIERFGDRPVYAHDPDTDWRLPIGLVVSEADPDEGLPERFEITTDYHARPEGDLSAK
jgi:hypothetical protein